MGAPYMYFFPAEYLNDTQHLTRAQHGSYLLLLMHYWQSGKPMNNANGRLAVVARMSNKEWEKEEHIYAEFFDVDGDIWTHGRVEFDLERIRKKSKSASYAGRMSASKRKKDREATGVDIPLNRKPTIYIDIDKNINKGNKYTDEFEDFWRVYPRKDGSKLKASQAFAKALKKTNLNEILKGVEQYANDSNRDPAYTKHGATWLNQECWEDAPLPQRKLTPQQKLEQPTRTPVRMKPEESAPRADALSPEQISKAVANTKELLRQTKG